MTRKASGFLTKTGHFYPTKKEADIREVLDDFDETFHAHLAEVNVTGPVADFVLDKVQEFMLLNKDVVKRYITLIDKVPEINKDDLRAILLQPATAPVGDFNYSLISEDDDESDFVSSFNSGTMGEDDGQGEDAGGDEMDRQLGEEEPSVPE